MGQWNRTVDSDVIPVLPTTWFLKKRPKVQVEKETESSTSGAEQTGKQHVEE